MFLRQWKCAMLHCRSLIKTKCPIRRAWECRLQQIAAPCFWWGILGSHRFMFTQAEMQHLASLRWIKCFRLSCSTSSTEYHNMSLATYSILKNSKFLLKLCFGFKKCCLQCHTENSQPTLYLIYNQCHSRLQSISVKDRQLKGRMYFPQICSNLVR